MSSPILYLEVPLRSRDGGTVGVAQVSCEDAAVVLGMKWYRDAYGYARNSKGQLMHRVILGLSKGDGLQGDHINGDRLDNRRENLRAVTWAQNAQNRGNSNRDPRGRSSMYRGVSRAKKRWRARVRHGDKEVLVGCFATEIEAARAAAAYRREVFEFCEVADVR